MENKEKILIFVLALTLVGFFGYSLNTYNKARNNNIVYSKNLESLKKQKKSLDSEKRKVKYIDSTYEVVEKKANEVVEQEKRFTELTSKIGVGKLKGNKDYQDIQLKLGSLLKSTDENDQYNPIAMPWNRRTDWEGSYKIGKLTGSNYQVIFIFSKDGTPMRFVSCKYSVISHQFHAFKLYNTGAGQSANGYYEKYDKDGKIISNPDYSKKN
ncbi:hypothetical protein [Ligilactobacillus equi]|uniref:Uncharacterized protein n=1 Tax=Ligilactobacillus equi DSM 15833 = JCM 10991 TaxID=1423740 RepID=A0A0R1TSM9_9LACO|nr:hypothetical protein [Ligilactobacillus equi]KRL84365.1 hypothetical protein FC36_GL000288 [Ligilactobacillus equi DSM 15833 = JCM 10991]